MVLDLATWWAKWKLRALGALVVLVLVGLAAFGVRQAVQSVADANARAATAERSLADATARERQLRADLAAEARRVEAANTARASSEARLRDSSKKLDRLVARVRRLDGDFRVLHDAAANGCAEPADDAARGRAAAPVDPQTLARTIRDNYCAAEANRQQVIRLQDLYRQRVAGEQAQP